MEVVDEYLVTGYLCLCQGAVNFKFGVLYCKERQTAETEMFSNGKHASLW